jgi:hypothetical protein
MIRPTKHIDLSSCVLRVASTILENLQDIEAARLDELDGIIRQRIGENARFNFLEALSFLFLLGAVEYDIASDAVFLTTKKNRTIA